MLSHLFTTGVLGPSQASAMLLFSLNNQRLEVCHCFRKKLHIDNGRNLERFIEGALVTLVESYERRSYIKV